MGKKMQVVGDNCASYQLLLLLLHNTESFALGYKRTSSETAEPSKQPAKHLSGRAGLLVLQKFLVASVVRSDVPRIFMVSAMDCVKRAIGHGKPILLRAALVISDQPIHSSPQPPLLLERKFDN